LLAVGFVELNERLRLLARESRGGIEPNGSDENDDEDELSSSPDRSEPLAAPLMSDASYSDDSEDKVRNEDEDDVDADADVDDDDAEAGNDDDCDDEEEMFVDKLRLLCRDKEEGVAGTANAS
jgi:hypothetical protein